MLVDIRRRLSTLQLRLKVSLGSNNVVCRQGDHLRLNARRYSTLSRDRWNAETKQADATTSRRACGVPR